MDSKIVSKENKNELNSKTYFENLKSDYFLQKLFEYFTKKKKLEIIRYNKNMLRRLNINIKDYKEYCETYTPIEIEIIPALNKYGRLINVKEDELQYYHIYFNDNKEEMKRYSLEEEDKVSKIKIIIDYQVKSFEQLFCCCKCVKSISFKKFYRINISNMSSMFDSCSSLEELNLSNLNTNNVNDMSCMFYECSSLKELNFSNFNNSKVTNMRSMFYKCTSLKELNLSNFNTNNVIDMSYMFYGCSSLEELNLSNFNTNKVTNMRSLFYECSSLKELNISNFDTNNVTNMNSMFYKCPEKLKLQMKSLNKFNIGDYY